MLRVRCEILRRRLIYRSREHKIKADRTAQSLWIGVGSDAVLKARREEDQQTRLRGEITVLRTAIGVVLKGSPMTHRQTWHQFIELAWGMESQTTIGSIAGAGEIKDSAEMCIGMVMATDALVPVTDHRPTTLETQGQTAAIKFKAFEVAPGCSRHLAGNPLEIRMPMQLPDAIKVSSPSTALAGVAGRLSSQGQQRLQLDRQIQRIQWQLTCGDACGEKILGK